MNKKRIIFNIAFSGLSVALCMVLPLITGGIPEIGNMLCPMHIPVILCGFICGYKYGSIVGFISPLLRSLLFGNRPPIYPTAVAMSFELCAYGFLSGFLFNLFNKLKFNNIFSIYLTLIISMLGGRVIWAFVMFIISLIDKTIIFNFDILLSGAFITAWPGIIIQIVLIPILIMLYLRFNGNNYKYNIKKQ